MGLDSVELVMEWEDEFEIDIPDEAAGTMRSIGDVTDWITAHLAAIGRPMARALVLEKVCAITCVQCGTTRDQLTETTRFIDDLGID